MRQLSDNPLLCNCEEFVVGLTLFFDLIAVGKSLLAVELVFFDQISPSFLTPFIASFELFNFLSEVDKLSALLL